jgi:hypothetical protein
MNAPQPYATEGDHSNFNTASQPHLVRRKFPWLRLGGTLISMSLFGLSLTGYGYATGDPTIPRNWASCFLLLLIGWLGLFEGITAWLANPTMGAAWLFAITPFRWMSFGLSVLAMFFALSFVFQRDILVNEAGHRAQIVALGFGYWIWISSMAFQAIWCLFDYSVSTRRGSP